VWPFPTKPAVLLCHCETFVVVNLRAFRDVRKMVFAISVCVSARLHDLSPSDVGKFNTIQDLDAEGGRSTLRIIHNYLPVNAASYSRRLVYSFITGSEMLQICYTSL
jgi:hypothetical protein